VLHEEEEEEEEGASSLPDGLPKNMTGMEGKWAN
jgi:hypothetical protein